MSASVREESGILVDFHFSEGGDFEFCSTFLRFQKVGARGAIEVVRGCAEGRRHSPRRHGEHGEYEKKGRGLGGKAEERQFTAAIRLVAQAPSGRSRPFGSQSLAPFDSAQDLRQGGEAPEGAERGSWIGAQARWVWGCHASSRFGQGMRWRGGPSKERSV